MAHRCWTWGAVAALIAEIVSGQTHFGLPGALLIVFLYFLLALYWVARTRSIREGSRFLRVAVVLAGRPAEVTGDIELFERCRLLLRGADHAAADREISPVAYEKVWSDVYELLRPQIRN
jgi:membrane protein implicated in regulation of membrane protease activity